jgi:hypothetical protein
MDYIDKKKKTTHVVAEVDTPMTTEGVEASNIKTGTPGKTILIYNKTGNVEHHIKIRNLSDWKKSGKTLFIKEINTSYTTKITLSNSTQAKLAEQRFIQIVNGEILI